MSRQMQDAPKPRHSDPAERHRLLRLFYRGWRPTRLGRFVNRVAGWLSLLGVGSDELAVLEVQGRSSGQPRSTPVVVATVEGVDYLVSMLGPGSEWVKNAEAAGGRAVLRRSGPGPGGRREVQLVPVPAAERAPMIRAYVRVATNGRHHIPVAVDAPLSAFERIARDYPVYRIDDASPS